MRLHRRAALAGIQERRQALELDLPAIPQTEPRQQYARAGTWSGPESHNWCWFHLVLDTGRRANGRPDVWTPIGAKKDPIGDEGNWTISESWLLEYLCLREVSGCGSCEHRTGGKEGEVEVPPTKRLL